MNRDRRKIKVYKMKKRRRRNQKKRKKIAVRPAWDVHWCSLQIIRVNAVTIRLSGTIISVCLITGFNGTHLCFGFRKIVFMTISCNFIKILPIITITLSSWSTLSSVMTQCVHRIIIFLYIYHNLYCFRSFATTDPDTASHRQQQQAMDLLQSH